MHLFLQEEISTLKEINSNPECSTFIIILMKSTKKWERITDPFKNFPSTTITDITKFLKSKSIIRSGSFDILFKHKVQSM